MLELNSTRFEVCVLQNGDKVKPKASWFSRHDERERKNDVASLLSCLNVMKSKVDGILFDVKER